MAKMAMLTITADDGTQGYAFAPPEVVRPFVVDTFFRKEPKTVKGTLLRSAVTFGVGLLVEKAGSGWLQMLRRKRQPA